MFFAILAKVIFIFHEVGEENATMSADSSERYGSCREDSNQGGSRDLKVISGLLSSEFCICRNDRDTLVMAKSINDFDECVIEGEGNNLPFFIRR